MTIKRTKQDDVFSKLVRLRARFNCEKCGTHFPLGHGLECAHIFGRRHVATRHDPDNAVALCHYHHRYFTENPVLFTEWIRSKVLGEVRYECLKLRHSQIVKRTKADLEALYKHLKSEYAALSQNPPARRGGL